MPFTSDGKYILGRECKDKAVFNYFYSEAQKEKVTYWKVFVFRRKKYIMTFQNNCYEVGKPND